MRLNHRKCVLKRNALFIKNVQGFADVITIIIIIDTQSINLCNTTKKGKVVSVLN
jgi:hypothetical protein